MKVPGKGLVGEDARLDNGVYQDRYLGALNGFVSVDDAFGNYRTSVARQERGSLLPLITGDALNSIDSAQHLWKLAVEAAHAGEWVAVGVDPSDCHLHEVLRKGYGYTARVDRDEFLLPSAKYVVHISQQLHNVDRL